MPEDLLVIILIISFFIAISPIYYQNQRVAKMAEEDLKKINYAEWKKQIRTNVYTKMFSRMIWGIFILSGYVFDIYNSLVFRWSSLFVATLGIAFIVWGIFGFRGDKKRIQKLD